jgi:lipoprotein-anchoring transpeptidase ErfK/SrfK
MNRLVSGLVSSAMISTLVVPQAVEAAKPAASQPAPAPKEPANLLPQPMLPNDLPTQLPDRAAKDTSQPAKAPATKQATVAPPPIVPPIMPPAPLPVVVWNKVDAAALLVMIDGISSRGLTPADYDADALRAAILAGEGVSLNEVASRAFAKLAIDLRDGRTPYQARMQWPVHPDYAALRAALAQAKPSETAKISAIRTNLDRWRWLPHDLGQRYVIVNVPEYIVRVVNKGRNVSTYRAIVGKPTSATPQLAENAVGVIFHPTWTIPQSIIKESVGAMIASRPAAAKARGYRWTGSGAGLSVVQAPGPGNSLGMMKVDMPNPHAIFLHDTNARGLFEKSALSHGCIRTDRAAEFGMVLALLQAGIEPTEAATIIKAGENAKIAFTDPIPVYVAYFTYASDPDGKLTAFEDIYGRDKPVVSSFAKPREEKILPAVPQKIIANDAPGT